MFWGALKPRETIEYLRLAVVIKAEERVNEEYMQQHGVPAPPEVIATVLSLADPHATAKRMYLWDVLPRLGGATFLIGTNFGGITAAAKLVEDPREAALMSAIFAVNILFVVFAAARR